MMTDEEEETEYGTEIYDKLKELRISVIGCSTDTAYLINRMNHFLEEYDVQKGLNDEIENLTNQFKDNCKCIKKI